MLNYEIPVRCHMSFYFSRKISSVISSILIWKNFYHSSEIFQFFLSHKVLHLELNRLIQQLSFN